MRSARQARTVRTISMFVVAALAATACGDDDKTDTTAGTAAAPVTTAAATEPAVSTTQVEAPATTAAEVATTGAPETSPTTEDTSPASTAEELEPFSVKFGLLQGAGTTLTPYIAERAGIFEEHAVDVEFVPVQGGAASLANFIAGDIDILINGPAFQADALESGVELKLFCGAHLAGRSTFIVRDDSDLRSFEDGATSDEILLALEGRSVAVPSVGGLPDRLLQAALAELGVEDPENYYEAVALAGAGPTLAALLGGDIDVAYGFPFSANSLLADPGTRLLIDLTDDGPEIFSTFHSGWVAEPDFIEENRAGLQRFCEAMGEAYDFTLDDANAELAETVLIEDVGLSPEAIASIQEMGLANATYPLSNELPRDVIQANLDFLAANGLLAEGAATSYDDYVMTP